MEVIELTAAPERRPAVPVVRQLWTDATPAEVREWTSEEDYHLFGGFVEGDLVGVAGVCTTSLLHHAPHAWLYDLVVDEPRRDEGHGTALVRFVEAWARERGRASVALASPLAKEGVHRFYEHIDYERWGYVVEKRLEGDG